LVRAPDALGVGMIEWGELLAYEVNFTDINAELE
jgi:hypothetical protein